MDGVADKFLTARQRKRGRDIERHTETRLDLAEGDRKRISELERKLAAAERLLIAGIVANDAIGRGVSAGDLMWHGGVQSFEMSGVVMDAPGLLEYARARLAEITD